MSTTTTTTEPRDLYQEVTDRIIAALRNGVCPWRKDWNATSDTPRNWENRPYRGINWLTLSTLAFTSPVYVTFKKALELGGQVRKGEKGQLVVFWKFFKSKDIDPNTGKFKMIPMLRHYYVFNVDQCENLPTIPTVDARPFEPLEECERIVAELTSANLCAHAGIASPVIDNQAAYLQSWLNVLQADTKAIVWAAGKAARAADFILGRTFEDSTTEDAATR